MRVVRVRLVVPGRVGLRSRSGRRGLSMSLAVVVATAVGVIGGAARVAAAPSCGSACYVDAASGNDSKSGSSASPLKTIQAGIDAVSPGGTVFVRPGNYSETAANRSVVTLGGTYQFGLYLGNDGVTVQGVHADDSLITSRTDPAIPDVKTNSTANFGPDGVFVQGDHDTIAGIHIDENLPSGSCNKSIEVIGDAFTFRNGIVNDPCGGDIYIDDFRYNTGTQTPHVNSYIVTGSEFGPGNTIDIGNGPGHGTSAASRQITNNVFDGEGYWPAISFNGADSGVAWFVYPVGGATITGNTFPKHQDQYIRARGTYDTATFDWNSYFGNNTFAGASMTVTGGHDVRTYSYSYVDAGSCPSTPGNVCTWNNVRRINGTLQATHGSGCVGADCNGDITNAQPGDTVQLEGAFGESINLTKAVSLQGVHQTGQIPGALLIGNSGTGITVNAPGTLSIVGLNILGYPISVAVLTGSVPPTVNRDALVKLTNAGNGPVDGTCNWWGSTSGPGAGATVGTVTTAPWLLSKQILVANCLPVASLSPTVISVHETNGGLTTVNLTVHLDRPSSRTVTVAWHTADGTAKQPGDYQAASGTLSFAPGQTANTITVKVKDDKVVEPAENLRVILASPTNAILGNASETIQILPDE